MKGLPRGPSGLIPESFVPMNRSSPLKGEEESRRRVPSSSVEGDRKDEVSPVSGAPVSISPSSSRGPWGPKTGGTPQKDSSFDEDVHQACLQDIVKKGSFLPLEFTSHIKAIVESAENILQCMRTDPADVFEGDRFLRRYLPITLQLIESCHHLSTSDPDTARVADVGHQALAMLERLEAAFKKEHADLLENDVMSFSADMNAIDRLLKMEGH